MVGDELGEKIVSIGFRTSGKVTAETLKKLFNLIIKKGGLLFLVKTGGLAKLGIHKVLEKNGIDHTVGTNRQKFSEFDKDGGQKQGIEVEKSQMRDFDKYAKKYKFEYALQQETNDPNHYFFIFRDKDISKMDMAMQDYLKDKTIDHGDLDERIEKAKAQAFNVNKANEKTKQHTKSHNKNRSVER